MGLLKWMSSKFLREEEPEQKEEAFEFSMPEDIPVKVFTPELLELEEVGVYDPSKPTMLLMDDQKGMLNTVEGELRRVPNSNKYNIIKAYGRFAAFSVEKYLASEEARKIDLAFLDITLGGIIDGTEYDGIDVAKMLKDKNKDCRVYFLTGHPMNRKVPVIFHYIEKFSKVFNREIDEVDEDKGSEYIHVVQKAEDRVVRFTQILEEHLRGFNEADRNS